MVLILLVLLLISAVLTGGIGAMNISFSEGASIWKSWLGLADTDVGLDMKSSVLWHIRYPRVIMSLAIGASLAISGSSLQGLFRNPMADPSIIGVSAGATLFVAMAIVLLNGLTISTAEAFGLSTLSIVAFAGAVVAALVVYKLASNKVRTDVATMLLAGIAINALAMALVGLLSYLTNDAQLRNIVFFTLGSLGGTQWFSAGLMLVVTLLAMWLLLPTGKHLNALSLGEQEAASIGTPIQKLKRRIILTTSAVIGISVAFSGIIGFVGLVIPHLLRMMGVKDYRRLLLYSALSGALLLCWTDTLSRTLFQPAEIPIGVITSLLGAPIFLILIYKTRARGL